jgi:hypothetical protein
MKTIFLGKLGPLMVSAFPNVVIGIVALWAILAAVAYWVLRLPLIEALIGGLIATFIHYSLDYLHQLGHYLAGKRAGYPMKGIRYWLVLAQSIYPSDEPELPARIHIQRALGGPTLSALITIITGVLMWVLIPVGGLAFWLALFAFIEIVFVFTLGAFIPLPVLDGGTLLHYWGKR